MEILVINFSLEGVTEADYRKMCDDIAPAFAAVPGLVSKVWLADRASGVYGGVYTFENGAALDTYLASDLFAEVAANPALVDITNRPAARTRTSYVPCGTDTTRRKRLRCSTSGWSGSQEPSGRSVTGPERWWVAQSSPSGATSHSRSNATTRSCGAYARHAALRPLCNGQRTLVVRRALARDTGEGPSGVQAAAWLDCKRHYFQMRPQLGRTYIGIADPTPFADALAVLGFQFLEPVSFGDDCYHPAALEFGPESVDGWLSRLAAAELGITDRGFLDPGDRTVDLGAQRVQLSPSSSVCSQPCRNDQASAVTRAEAHHPGLGYDVCRGKQRGGCRRAQPPPEARSRCEPRADRPRCRLPPQLVAVRKPMTSGNAAASWKTKRWPPS